MERATPAGEYAAQRDQIAHLRDLTAELRDRDAEGRDADAVNQSWLDDPWGKVEEAARNHAALDRAASARDRCEAAEDRERANVAGALAAAESVQAGIALVQAQHDDLTGVYSRDQGNLTLQRELDRAARTGAPFVLGFLDVDGLKELNDRRGHAAGDAHLLHVVHALKLTLRSYDPVVRCGGDEFLCGFTDTDLTTAERRVKDIQAAVAQGFEGGSVTAGLAERRDGENLEALTARADRDMYERRGGSQRA